MKIHGTLSLYIARQFLLAVGLSLLVFSALVVLLDIMELLRRSGNKDTSAFILTQLALLRYPLMGQKMLPFVMLIGTILAYARMARRNELIVMRGAGVSVWQFLLPTGLVAFGLGILLIVAINPLGALMIKQYERLESKYLQSRSSMMTLMPTGLWLKETVNHLQPVDPPALQIIVHAREMGTRDNINLRRVMILMLGVDNIFLRRLDANSAALAEGYWQLKDVTVTEPDGTPKHVPEYNVSTSVTLEDIQQSFASPDTLSFWQLPDFIDTLNKSGFSDLPHRMQWHNLLATPFLYVAMVYLAAVFSIHTSRRGNTGLLLTAGIFSGFLMYFLMNLVFSLGLAGSMPVVMAAWTPVLLALLMGVGMLLHYEDG